MAFLVVDVAMKRPSNLMSLLGIVIYVFLTFIFSANPEKVRMLMLLSHRNAEYLVLCTLFARQLHASMPYFFRSTGDVIYMITYILAVKRDGHVRSYII